MIASLLAPLKVEFKNLWWDFRKVVQYFNQNEIWLRPMLDRVGNKPRG